jgi:hypothetical protein
MMRLSAMWSMVDCSALKGGLGGGDVPSGDRLLDLLDGAAKGRAQALVGPAGLGGLLGALRRLLGVGHSYARGSIEK